MYTRTRLNLLLANLAFVLCNLLDSTTGDAPNFISGFGLTLRKATQIDTRLYEVFVSSEQVRGDQMFRIVVPTDYATSGTSRRYPVLYLLHGATGNPYEWTTAGAALNITNNASVITITPNGDPFGFYTNWVIPGDAAPQNWKTYHMEQLVPWIDLNLRTVAKKEGRAIGGLSMGGFGAMHYIECYSDNFIYGASFSGAVDLLDPEIQKRILALPGPGKPLIGPFGYPNASESSNGWISEDTVTHTNKLHNVSIAIYIGNAGDPEFQLRNGSYRLRDSLLSQKIPVYLDDYGNGQSIGYGCDGAHDWACWRASLINVLPRMMAVLEQKY